MFDVLVYLFESYIHPTACPRAEHLVRKLSAAGFDSDEIDSALNWLTSLREHTSRAERFIAPSDGSLRLFADSETSRLDSAGRGFLSLLESAGMIDAEARELVIDRALALDDVLIGVEQLKVMVLMVLWQQGKPIDCLIFDELIDAGNDEPQTYH